MILHLIATICWTVPVGEVCVILDATPTAFESVAICEIAGDDWLNRMIASLEQAQLPLSRGSRKCEKEEVPA